MSKVEVIYEDHTEDVCDKAGIEQACHNENNDKFKQTNNTPPMRGALADDLGYIGLSPACHYILQGLYPPPPDTPPYTSEYLQRLKKAPTIQDPPSAYLATYEF